MVKGAQKVSTPHEEKPRSTESILHATSNDAEFFETPTSVPPIESSAGSLETTPRQAKATPQKAKSAQVIRGSRRVASHRERDAGVAAQKEEFVKEVWKHRAALGIDETTGEVLGAQNKPIKGSHYAEVIADLFTINPRQEKGAILQHRINRHPELGPLFRLLKPKLTPKYARVQGGKGFRPAKWK